MTAQFEPCVYRDFAEEAFIVDPATRTETPVELWLCTWPTSLPVIPPWLDARLGGCSPINPESDCINCHVRREK